MSTTPPPVGVRPVTPRLLPDLATLFGTSKTTTGCYCMWFIASAKQCQAGWGEGNRRALEALARSEDQPMGLLAYRDGEPAGWCAAGPRARYARALRSAVLAGRDAAADETVWLVPCFYVRRDARKLGVARALLEGAVELARTHGASAIEGFPLAGDARRAASSVYVGAEPVFARTGFTVIARPTANRVVMRRDL